MAKSLINAPKLLLLDEPTSALDPMGREEVLDTLRSLRGRTTVFFSTHILADARDISESSISSIAAATAACRRA